MGFGFAGCLLFCNCHGFGCCRGGFWVLKRGFGVGSRGVGRRGVWVLGLLGKGGRGLFPFGVPKGFG